MWARQLAWLQCPDEEKGPTRWSQLKGAAHILPERGNLFDAVYILQRLGICTPLPMGGITSLSAGQVLDFAAATGWAVSPFDVDAALLASDAYVAEYNRSTERSTDAPWDWPKTERDLEILKAQEVKAIKAITGE